VLPARAQVRTFTAADLEADAPHVASDWSAWWPAHGAWLPLTDRAGHALGGVVFAREAAWSATDCALLTELGQVWAHAFEAFAPRASWLERARAVLRPGRQQRRVLIGLAVACVIPLRLTVLAPAEVTPKDPFVVRAPLDGVIDRLYVKPNQPVQRGTPLLGLDATALQSRYALARKDFDAEQEEFRQTAQLAVTDDRTRLDMAERKGKLDQSQVQLDYTAQQLARVKVNAERAGVAVFSDPNEWTGKAVAVGEKILLLADPARVELTAWLPVADNIDVKPGATLTLYPKSSPLSSYEAHIDSIAYRAEPTPDGVLAYRVRASFVTADANAPLGAMGTARIRGPWVPAIYYVLRRPLTLARQWLGW
ncbi:HlyD family efflux transporter periplasmic adaptor subunit, partial [Paraburkholderia sp. Cy-641]|uniref:efflux RND transporter periplasmic adaptor subunit n=1 Tax=Paraburkholderia sp. Cy-641 TaxID=2608337 RepID=UPI0014242F52